MSLADKKLDLHMFSGVTMSCGKHCTHVLIKLSPYQHHSWPLLYSAFDCFVLLHKIPKICSFYPFLSMLFRFSISSLALLTVRLLNQTTRDAKRKSLSFTFENPFPPLPLPPLLSFVSLFPNSRANEPVRRLRFCCFPILHVCQTLILSVKQNKPSDSGPEDNRNQSRSQICHTCTLGDYVVGRVWKQLFSVFEIFFD